VFLGVENLFDETYEVGKTGTGLVTIGAPFRVHAGVRWKLVDSNLARSAR
jgi:hypothetical protein